MTGESGFPLAFSQSPAISPNVLEASELRYPVLPPSLCTGAPKKVLLKSRALGTLQRKKRESNCGQAWWKLTGSMFSYIYDIQFAFELQARIWLDWGLRTLRAIFAGMNERIRKYRDSLEKVWLSFASGDALSS